MSNIAQKATCFFRLFYGFDNRVLPLAQSRSYGLIGKRSFTSAKPDQEAAENQKAAETQAEEVANDNKASEEIAKLNESLADFKDKYQRSLAENENVRKRLRKEIADAKLYAIQGFCKDLLDVADVLSKAVDSVSEDSTKSNAENSPKQWKDFYDGVILTNKELLAVFKRHGLEAFTPGTGDKFDPNKHEAMFQAPVKGMDSGLIAHVQTIGYSLNGRTLRPAQVGVSK